MLGAMIRGQRVRYTGSSLNLQGKEGTFLGSALYEENFVDFDGVSSVYLHDIEAIAGTDIVDMPPLGPQGPV